MYSYSKLPLRIREEIEAQQYTGELLVTGVQLGVIVLLSIINFFSSAGYSPGAPVQSSSLGLWLFTILVLARLWFVYTNQLNSMFLGFSIVAEMALLLFIIWTYYLQFETTPTINLKNPHINYVYILIALRALRFEPIWVILSGLTAAIGWGIIAWQTLSSSGMKVITWDYVTFASTRSVYLGAVFDVILSVLLVTLIIALVLTRAKRTLFQAVEQTSAAKDLSRFFDTSVVEKITTSEKSLQAGYGELRQAAVMFIDMRGFTKASNKLSPSELIGLLGEYQHLVVPIIQKNNGSIDKFMGDGILASFGAVAPSNTYAADALRTVDEIISSISVWSDNRRQKGDTVVGVGIGLSSGEVVIGVIGHENRLEYTVIGETVNLAAKLEKHNKEEKTQALTTKNTFVEALKQGYKSDIPKEELKARNVGGVEGPLDLVALVK